MKKLLFFLLFVPLISIGQNVNMQEIYRLLSNDGFYTKSYDEFFNKYGDEEGQKELYTKLNDDGLYTKTFKDFKIKYVKTSNTTQGKNNEGLADELEGIVQRMIDAGEPEENIDMVIEYWNRERRPTPAKTIQKRKTRVRKSVIRSKSKSSSSNQDNTIYFILGFVIIVFGGVFIYNQQKNNSPQGKNNEGFPDELVGIVQRMIDAGESEENIYMVIEEYYNPTPAKTIVPLDQFKSSVADFIKNMGHVEQWHKVIQKRGEGHAMFAKSMGIKVDDYEYWANAHKEEYIMKYNEGNLDVEGLKLRIEKFGYIVSELEKVIKKAAELKLNITTEMHNDYCAARASVLGAEYAFNDLADDIGEDKIEKEEIASKDIKNDSDNESQQNKNKFCANCGIPISENKKFCTNCGNKLT